MKATYLDSSALVKLVVLEPESLALRRYLTKRPNRVSSALSRVEVPRAVRRHGTWAIARAWRVLSGIRLILPDTGILDAAADLDPASLRSLDAIHLASARVVGSDLESIVTHDTRMLVGARSSALRVASPA